MAHLGLTPQSVHRMSGYRVQGKSVAAIHHLVKDALALEAAGAFAVVLEGIPAEVAQRITAALHIPTIGIGAGPCCDGQILVLHDLINLSFSAPAKFVRRYGDAAALITDAVHPLPRRCGSTSIPGRSGKLSSGQRSDGGSAPGRRHGPAQGLAHVGAEHHR